jgi:Holliday junction resolvasome RuvABC DNA-binding subunit
MLKINYINLECDNCGEINLNYQKIMECNCGQKLKTVFKIEKSPMDIAINTLLALGYSRNDIRNAAHNAHFLSPQDMIEHVKKYVDRTTKSKKAN